MKIYLSTGKVKKEWTDYNGHMNLSYYILVFDMGAEVILSNFEIGEHSAKTTKTRTIVVDSRTIYLFEVSFFSLVIISLSYFYHDNLRLHYKLEMP